MRPVLTPDTASCYDVSIDTETEGALNVLDIPDTEAHWLPVIGPTAMVLARRLVMDGTDGAFYLASDLARDLGVGVPRLWAAFRRLERAKLVYIEPSFSKAKAVTVRAYWPIPRPKAVDHG